MNASAVLLRIYAVLVVVGIVLFLGGVAWVFVFPVSSYNVSVSFNTMVVGFGCVVVARCVGVFCDGVQE